MKHRHKLKIKHLLNSVNTIQDIENISTEILKNLELIKETLYTVDNLDLLFGDLLDIIYGFKDLIDMCNGTIPFENWDYYLFDGNYGRYFNEYLKLLYELSNQEIVENGTKYKFILIE